VSPGFLCESPPSVKQRVIVGDYDVAALPLVSATTTRVVESPVHVGDECRLVVFVDAGDVELDRDA